MISGEVRSNPSVGDVVNGREIDLCHTLHIWSKCPKCSKERWVAKGKLGVVCGACARQKSASVMRTVEYRRHQSEVSLQIANQKRSNNGCQIWDGIGIPVVGMICRASDLGYNTKSFLVWATCSRCGKARWLSQRNAKLKLLCKNCVKQQSWSESHSKTVRQNTEARYISMGYEIWQGEGIPKEGMIASSKTIGLKGYAFVFRTVCPKCSRERWVQKKLIGHLCKSCENEGSSRKGKIGKLSGSWRGGRSLCRSTGYVILWLSSDSPFIGMAKKTIYGTYQILEHRLIIAQYLGRLLEPWEIVHHKNGKRDDNLIENLELLSSNKDHLPYTRMKIRVRELEQRVTLLEAQNVLLKIQVGVVND